MMIQKKGLSTALSSGRRTLFRLAAGPISLHGDGVVVTFASSDSILRMSSSSNPNPNTSAFCAMRLGVTDLGMTTTPRSTFQRSSTCAGVTPCLSAMDVTVGSVNTAPP